MFNNWIIKRISLFVTINLCLAQIERDIVLTPKLSLHRNGKILYYEPITNDVNNNITKVPWEQTLKHVTFLTLHNRIDEKSQNISHLPEYQNFLNATYIRSNDYIPKFGDIITLARGRLEKSPNNQYFFIEGQCSKRCPTKPLAYWIIQKIRHRDPEKTFRYELKIGIIPNVNEKSDSNKRETANKHESKAFILKEDDYPTNFANVEKHIAQRRSDENTEYVDKIDKFNDVFAQSQPQPQYFRNKAYENVHEPRKYHFPDLNLGEYIPVHHASDSNIDGIANYNKVLFPTTFHPNYKLSPGYGIRFSEKPSTSMEEHTSTAHHLHHHYYIMKNNFPDTKTDTIYPPLYPPLKDNSKFLDSQQHYDMHQFHTSTPIANQIPVPPNLHISKSPYKIPATRPIIPSPPRLMYMNPVPIYPINPFNEHIKPKHPFIEPTKPFIESSREQTIRYSDPDPLYHNTAEDTTAENHIEHTIIPVKEDNLSDEHTSNSVDTNTQKFDDSEISESEKRHNSGSINVQLPAPDSDSHSSSIEPLTKISYVTQTSAVSAYLIAPKTSTEPPTTPSNIEATISEPTIQYPNHRYDTSEENSLNTGTASTIITTTATKQTPIIKHYYRTTTEGPVLRWKPKRPYKTSKITLPSISVTLPNSLEPTTEITTKYEFERIPVNATEKVITVTPSRSDTENDNEEIPTKQSVSTSISIKVGTEINERPFVPTISLPNVELYKANLENIKTNSSKIKLYRASESKRKIQNDKNEETELAKSIVEHGKNLT